MDNETSINSSVKVDKAEKQNRSFRLLKLTKWVSVLMLESIVLLLAAAYFFLLVLARGPSPTASKLFVRSVSETSAIGFLADIFFTDEEITSMLSVEETVFTPTDTELIELDTDDHTVLPDAWGFTDEDGDGIIIDPVKGESYIGYMMIILDPSRVIMATCPDNYGFTGYTVETFVKNFGAVAGINGGAFDDPGGSGDGSTPDGLVVFEGRHYMRGMKDGFAGIDADHILHVGCKSSKEVMAANIQYGASYGPVLIQNGEIGAEDALESGLNPRTAIGQRSDGAFLFLVIEGRQVYSLGATYFDEAEIMLRYGAVNALNLDGGSSSMMWYNNEYVNTCASVVGIRRIPTAFIVMPQS